MCDLIDFPAHAGMTSDRGAGDVGAVMSGRRRRCVIRDGAIAAFAGNSSAARETPSGSSGHRCVCGEMATSGHPAPCASPVSARGKRRCRACVRAPSGLAVGRTHTKSHDPRHRGAAPRTKFAILQVGPDGNRAPSRDLRSFSAEICCTPNRDCVLR